MIPVEHEEQISQIHWELTGGYGEHAESVAPLICNTTNANYGTLVPIRGEILSYTRMCVVEATGKEIWNEFTDEYDKTIVECGDSFLTVYLHENYRQSTPENIGRIVLAWVQEELKKKDEEL